MPRAIVPVAPGAFSAVGLALAAESFEETQPIGRDLDSLTARQLSQLAHHLGTRARRALGRGRATQTQVDALLRYRGQGESVRVPFAADMAAALHRRHQQLYGFTPTNAAIELVDLRARAERAAPSWPSADARSNERRHGALPATSRRAPAGSRRWRVYQRADLPAGTKLRGPCLVEEATGVTVVPAACECSVTPLALILL